MALRKDNAISKGEGKVFERVDNGREEEASPFFPRSLRSSEIPRRVNGFPIIGPWFRDQILSARQWLELMSLLASILIIGILNMASCQVNFPFLEAFVERFNYQTNTFFLPIGQTTPTLEEVAKISGLNLVGIAYQPSTATDDHSIMGTRLLGAAYSSHVDSYFPYSFSPCLLGTSGLHHRFAMLAGIYRGLHDRVTRDDRFIEGTQTKPGGPQLADITSVAQTWAYEHIAIVSPPRSTMAVSAALGLVYVNDTTRPHDVNHYRKILDELSSFDWVIRGLKNFRHTQNYTSPGEAIDRRPLFLLRWHSFTVLVKTSLSWKGKKSSSSEGLAKKDKPTTTSNYDSWWERACPLPLCPRSSRLHGKSSAPAQDLVPHRKDGASCSNKRIKSNENTSDIR
ncbi:hypothetical protein AMTRI_Chr02g218120 [Amborella trichopoda]